MHYQANNQPRSQLGHLANPRSPWPLWPLKAALAVLFLGPLLAPLFQATQLPLVADSGALARDLLSLYVCPTPAKSYMLLGFPMAVCARCWGATVGLWAAWLVLERTNAYDMRGGRLANTGRSTFALAPWALLRSYFACWWPARLGIGALPFWLWVAEIRSWPAAPYWLLLLNGAFAGCAAGLFFYSLWPGLRRSPATFYSSLLNS